MQKFLEVDNGNPDGTAKDAIVGVSPGTNYKSKVWNDNLFNLFKFVESQGYSLVDDDLSQISKASKALYNPAYLYNTSAVANQTVNDIVLGSDGVFYEADSDGINADNPVGSVTGNWKVADFQYSRKTDTLVTFRALTIPQERIYVTGHTSANDGAFGSLFFEWNSTSTESDNNGTIIKLTSVTTGRYKLQYEGVIRAKWFGTVGDGTTDDTTAIQNALNVGSVILPPLTRISTLTLVDGASIIGNSGIALIRDGGVSIVNCINGTGITNISMNTDVGVDASGEIKNIIFKAENIGGVCIQTEVGAGIALDNRPRFSFENLLFRGTTLGSSSVWEYDEGWEKCLSIGDCFSTRINKVSIYGTYDITQTESASPDDIGIYMEASSSARAIRITNYQTSDCKFPINIGNNVTSLYLSDFDFSRSHSGIVSSHTTNSAEVQINQGYVNSQYVGIDLKDRSWAFVNGVNVTRHASGFDHFSDWIGVKLGANLNDSSISNMRVLDSGIWVNVGSREAYQLDDVLRSKFSGITCDSSDGNLDYGFNISNSSQDLVFTNIIMDDVDVWWNFGAGSADISIANVEHRGTVTSKYLFDASIAITSINNNFRIDGFHVNAETENAAYESIFRLKRVTGQEWNVKQATNDEFIIRDVTNGENRIEILDSATTGLIKFGGTLRPILDNSYDLGSAALRWRTVYAGTGTINTSDDREKTYIDITDVEKLVALELKANMRKFKFNDAIEEKGVDKARIHFGASAQTVKSIFEKHNLIAEDYALLCYDEWEEETDQDGKVIVEAGNRYGLRYEELLSFIISAI